jgi:signal transduction histidine kinase
MITSLLSMATTPTPRIDLRVADPERLLRQRESLREVIEDVSGELELRPLLTRIARVACELLDARHSSIGLYDGTRNVFRTEAVYHVPPNELGMELGLGDGLAGMVLESRRPVVLDRYGEVPKMVVPELAEDAVLGVPIEWHDRLIGFFGVGAPPPRRFDAQDVETLALFARHAAIAIQNALQYQREAGRSERLQLIARAGRMISQSLDLDELLKNAEHVVHELLGFPNIALALVDVDDPEWLVIRAVAGYYKKLLPGEHRKHLSQGIVGSAARERRIQLVNDVHADPRYMPAPGSEEIRAELAVPLLVGRELVGIMNIESPGQFTEDDAASMQIVADHLAVAIQNVRLYQQAGRLAVLEERQRLARELHDSITQKIFSASLLSQSINPAWRRDPAEGERIADRLAELTRTSLAEMRTLLHELRPAVDSRIRGEDAQLPGRFRLQRDGLATTLRHEAPSIVGDAFEVTYDVRGDVRPAGPAEEALFRIAQEALHNVVKHARCRKVRLTLALDEREALLAVADDGVGFDVAAALAASGPDGLGLRSMRERAEGVGGALRLTSASGCGTTVEAVVPGGGPRP